MFLVPKGDKWRLIIYLRHLNKFCKDFSVKYETLKKLRHMAKQNDWCFAGRVLCSRDKGARPGFLYSKLSRTPFKVGVSSHGLERQPLRFLYVNAADDSLLAITASCDGESENPKQEKLAWTKVERVETSPIPRRLSFPLKKQETSFDRSKSCGEYAQSAGFSSKREERFLGACTSFGTTKLLIIKCYSISN
jgi:hypothetical protein